MFECFFILKIKKKIEYTYLFYNSHNVINYKFIPFSYPITVQYACLHRASFVYSDNIDQLFPGYVTIFKLQITSYPFPTVYITLVDRINSYLLYNK